LVRLLLYLPQRLVLRLWLRLRLPPPPLLHPLWLLVLLLQIVA
jgi:hypothetical protein